MQRPLLSKRGKDNVAKLHMRAIRRHSQPKFENLISLGCIPHTFALGPLKENGSIGVIRILSNETETAHCPGIEFRLRGEVNTNKSLAIYYYSWDRPLINQIGKRGRFPRSKRDCRFRLHAYWTLLLATLIPISAPER